MFRVVIVSAVVSLVISIVGAGMYKPTIGSSISTDFVKRCQDNGGEVLQGFMPNGKHGAACFRVEGIILSQ